MQIHRDRFWTFYGNYVNKAKQLRINKTKWEQFLRNMQIVQNITWMIPVSFRQTRLLWRSVSDCSRLLNCHYCKQSEKIFGQVGPWLNTDHTGWFMTSCGMAFQCGSIINDLLKKFHCCKQAASQYDLRRTNYKHTEALLSRRAWKASLIICVLLLSRFVIIATHFVRTCDTPSIIIVSFYRIVLIVTRLVRVWERSLIITVFSVQICALCNAFHQGRADVIWNHCFIFQIRAHCNAFRQGMADVINLEWLRMFDPDELQVLISGAPVPVDLDDLKKHTNYSGILG